MFALLSELNFWTFDNDVNIKDTDFGAFSYHDKKIDNPYAEGKRCYAQKRELIYIPQNKKGNKLKDSIKYLEEQLKEFTCIYCQWFDYYTVSIMLNSGLIIYIQVDVRTGDIDKIIFDKYLVGKLSDRLSDAMITKNYIVCIYNDTQITLVYFLKSKKDIFDKMSKLDTKIATFHLQGPCGKRIEKTICYNHAGDLMVIWWKHTMNEVYPWSPSVKDHDRANVHLYRVCSSKVEFLYYLRTEFDPLCITFSRKYDNVIHSVEQKVSRKGEVTVEWRTYEVSSQDKLHVIEVVSIPLPTHTSCVRFSPNQDMLLLGCIDGTMTLHDHSKGSNKIAKAGFIPTLVSWHFNGSIFSIGNERGQMQYFDVALSCLQSQILSEDLHPTNVLDLSSYFKTQPTLLRIEWCHKSDQSFYLKYYNRGDALLLLLFERGPLAVLKVIGGDSFTYEMLINQYLSSSHIENAVSLLLAMDWNSTSHVCMYALNKILNYLFKLPLNPERENLIQNALGSFHVPVKPINHEVIEEYGEEVRDLTRRFFHHLLRYRLFETAFRLAIDLEDHDLFMDIHYYAVMLKDDDMAKAAREKAEEILSKYETCSSSHSTCSRSSCSICSDILSNDEFFNDETENEEPLKRETRHSKRYKSKYKDLGIPDPPLPILYPSFNSGTVATTPFNGIGDTTQSNSTTTSFNSINYNIPSISYNVTLPNFLSKKFLTDSTNNFNKTLKLNSLSTDFESSLSLKKNDNLIGPLENLAITPSIAQSSLNSMSLENITNDYSITNDSEVFVPLPHKKIDLPLVSTYSKSRADVSTSTLNKTTFSKIDFPFDNNLDFQNNGENKIIEITTMNSKINSIIDVVNTKSVNDECTSTISMFNNSAEHPLFNMKNNLMSTAFNEPEDTQDETNLKTCDSSSNSTISSKVNIPPLPPVANSLSKYMHDFPKANYAISNRILGLDRPVLNSTRSMIVSGHQFQQDSSEEKMHRNEDPKNIFSAPKYRLDYDLDYIPFHSTYDDLHFSTNNNSKIHLNEPNLSKDNNHAKLLSESNITYNSKEIKNSSNIPPLPVLNFSANEKYVPVNINPTTDTTIVNERPKVKFSDTVTHILVPNSNETFHPYQKNTHMSSSEQQKQLIKNVPLYTEDGNYLKSLQLSSKSEESKKEQGPKKEESPAKIKVVHFGLL